MSAGWWTFKYPERAQTIRQSWKKTSSFQQIMQSSQQVFFCSSKYSTGYLENIAFKGNDNYRKRSPTSAEHCSPPCSLHSIFQPATFPSQQTCCPDRQLSRVPSYWHRTRHAEPMPPESTERPFPAEWTGSPELLSSSSSLVQHTTRVPNQHGSCFRTLWLTQRNQQHQFTMSWLLNSLLLSLACISLKVASQNHKNVRKNWHSCLPSM